MNRGMFHSQIGLDVAKMIHHSACSTIPANKDSESVPSWSFGTLQLISKKLTYPQKGTASSRISG
jgi:hypothetical protein